MSTPKWKGAAGLGYTGDATTAIVAGSETIYPIAETIDAKGEPATYERVTSQQPDVLNINRAGMDYSYTVDGMQASCGDIGYLLWLALGSETYSAGDHQLSPADDSLYFGFNIDRKLDLGSTLYTERYVGCKIGSLTIEQPLRDYAKVSFSGLCCDKHATNGGALDPSVSTDADNQPLDWGALIDTGSGSYCKIGYDGAGSQDNEVQGFKIELTRSQAYGGYTQSGGQPTAILEGGRRLNFEITREFGGSNAIDDYNAWKDNESIEFSIRYDIGSHMFSFIVYEARVVGSFAGEIGAGEDAIMATLVCTATYPDSEAKICYAVVDDDTDLAYS